MIEFAFFLWALGTVMRSIEINKGVRTMTQPYRWITVGQAAALAQMSRGLIYAAVRSGALRSIRVGAGRSVRTTEQWVHQWLSASATGGPMADAASGVLRSA